MLMLTDLRPDWVGTRNVKALLERQNHKQVISLVQGSAGKWGRFIRFDPFSRQSNKRQPTKVAAFMMFVSPYQARSWLFRTHPTIEQRVEAAEAMTPGNMLAERISSDALPA